MLVIENKGQRQHHCPQCFKIAGPRCARKGHVVQCELHKAFHSPYSECPQCKDARQRGERTDANEEKNHGHDDGHDDGDDIDEVEDEVVAAAAGRGGIAAAAGKNQKKRGKEKRVKGNKGAHKGRNSQKYQ